MARTNARKTPDANVQAMLHQMGIRRARTMRLKSGSLAQIIAGALVSSFCPRVSFGSFPSRQPQIRASHPYADPDAESPEFSSGEDPPNYQPTEAECGPIIEGTAKPKSRIQKFKDWCKKKFPKLGGSKRRHSHKKRDADLAFVHAMLKARDAAIEAREADAEADAEPEADAEAEWSHDEF